MKRRNFLQKLGLSAGAAAVLPLVPPKEQKKMEPPKEVVPINEDSSFCSTKTIWSIAYYSPYDETFSLYCSTDSYNPALDEALKKRGYGI